MEHKLEFRRLLNRKLTWFRAFYNLVDIRHDCLTSCEPHGKFRRSKKTHAVVTTTLLSAPMQGRKPSQCFDRRGDMNVTGKKFDLQIPTGTKSTAGI
jgi:hypothetical protein